MLSKPSRKAILISTKLIVSSLVMTVLLQKISFEEIYAAAVQANLEYAVIAGLLVFLNLFFQYKKWHLLVRLENPKIANTSILFSLFAGMTLGFITPGRVGEFGRSLFIKNADWSRLLGFTVVDKLFSALMIYFFGIFGLSYYFRQNSHIYMWLPITLIALFLFAMILYFVLHPQLTRNILTRSHSYISKHPKLLHVASGLENIKRQTVIKLLLYNWLYVLTFFCQFYLLIFAFYPLPIYYGFLGISSIMIVKTLIPISIADLGIREGATVFFLGFFDVPQAYSLNASLLLFFINVLVPGVIGLIYILKNRFIGNLSINGF